MIITMAIVMVATIRMTIAARMIDKGGTRQGFGGLFFYFWGGLYWAFK